MESVKLPLDFQSSILSHSSYPENLPANSTTVYPSTRKLYKDRLDDLQQGLFVTNEELVEVAYREFDTASGKGTNINSHLRLRPNLVG